MITIIEEGTFSKGYLGSIGKLLYMPLYALYTCFIKCVSVLFDQIYSDVRASADTGVIGVCTSSSREVPIFSRQFLDWLIERGASV